MAAFFCLRLIDLEIAAGADEFHQQLAAIGSARENLADLIDLMVGLPHAS